MFCAIRAAIQVEKDSREAISEGIVEAYEKLLSMNSITSQEVVSLIISATSDLVSYNPAAALRDAGIDTFPLFCVQEMQTEGTLERTLRLLCHVECDKPRSQIKHIYLRGAQVLRPDLV